MTLLRAMVRFLFPGNEPADNPLVFSGKPLVKDLSQGADPWVER